MTVSGGDQRQKLWVPFAQLVRRPHIHLRKDLDRPNEMYLYSSLGRAFFLAPNDDPVFRIAVT